MPWCTVCATTKPASEFYRSPNTKNGLHPWCKACMSDWGKARYHMRKIQSVCATGVPSLDAIPLESLSDVEDSRPNAEAVVVGSNTLERMVETLEAQDATLARVARLLIDPDRYSYEEIARLCGYDGNTAAAKMWVYRKVGFIRKALINAGLVDGCRCQRGGRVSHAHA